MVATTGNSLPPPPRLTGEVTRDVLALQSWMGDLYQVLGLEANITGTQEQNTQDIASLTGATVTLADRVAKLERGMAAIAALAYLTGPISATYDPAQLQQAFEKINAILQGAREGTT